MVPVPGIDHIKTHLFCLSLFSYRFVKISLDEEPSALLIGKATETRPIDRFFDRDTEIKDICRVLEDGWK